MKNLKEIKGDASLRKFFRKKNKDYSSIIVFCKKDKFKNLLVKYKYAELKTMTLRWRRAEASSW